VLLVLSVWALLAVLVGFVLWFNGRAVLTRWKHRKRIGWEERREKAASELRDLEREELRDRFGTDAPHIRAMRDVNTDRARRVIERCDFELAQLDVEESNRRLERVE
jgi:hypothetical protein